MLADGWWCYERSKRCTVVPVRTRGEIPLVLPRLWKVMGLCVTFQKSRDHHLYYKTA